MAALAIAIVAVLALAPNAHAHTAFESSDPSDGATIERLVNSITVTFTGAAEPAGEGFQVLAPDGRILSPHVEVGDDERTFTLTLDSPLGDGAIGVRWSVRAGDAHPIEGAFSFTTTAPVPTALPEPPPDSGDSASAPPVTDDDPAESALTEIASPETAPPETAPTDLGTFLETNESEGISAADIVGFGGRALAIPAGMLAVGASALLLVLTGDLLREARRHSWIAIAAAIAAVGATVETISFFIDGASDLLAGQPGIAIVLRLLGALAIAAGSLGRIPPLQLGGSVAVIASFLFDGHTVSKGNRFVTGLADFAHVGAASVWIGGIALLLVVAKSANPLLRSQLPAFAARFSVIASAALAVVGLAGIALTATIIDSLSDIWTSTWGQTLMAKTLFVAVAVALGAHNHFRLVPAVTRNEPEAIARLGQTLRIEIVVLAVVAALTALLVVGGT